jgi:DNA-binding SARP family transcriptional activator
MEFRLLGALEVRRDERTVPLGGLRRQAVVATLALRANETVSVDQLTKAVWMDAPASPASNLRTYIMELRRSLRSSGEESSRLETRSSGYILATQPGEVDVDVFEQEAALGAQALKQRDLDVAIACFERAKGMWRGEPLAGLEAGSLLRAEAMRLDERRLAVAEQCVQARLELGDYSAAIGELRQLLGHHPYREGLWAALMLALHRSGHRAEALNCYQEARRLLVAELGVEPGADLQQLQRAVLIDRDLRAEPDPRSGQREMRISARRQLPMDVAEFTGRVGELRCLHEFARAVSGDGRGAKTVVGVCTIEGMAGVGKTRLAVRAAHEITQIRLFDEIQLYADLRGFDSGRPAPPEAVLESFLQLLGIPGTVIPRELDARAALFRDRLRGRRALLLLDNAASEEQVQPILPGSPGVLVIVTSRRSLAGLDGAHPLELGIFSQSDAVGLFTRIVGTERVTAEPAMASRIADLCGHLPIAITLAGRRLRGRSSWSLADLAARLEGSQRLTHLAAGGLTIRMVFDLSYRALSPDQQRMYRRLALEPDEVVTPEYAAALVGTKPEQAERLLESLLDERLLQQAGPGRYRFHDLLRCYARERAEAEETGHDDRIAV